MSNKTGLSTQQRQSHICKLLEAGRELGIAELAEMFSTSEMTIRRDLTKLQQRGQVLRTHGGVMPAERMMFEFDFSARRKDNQLAKRAIAKQAAKLISPPSRVILDAGTTTLELAYEIQGLADLTVITPSLAVASALQFSDEVQTVLLGGVIRRGSPDLTGAMTETMLDMFAADIAFQGADAIDADGWCYNSDLRIAKIDQKMRQRARQVYVLADSSKLGKTALVRNGTLNQVDGLITDDKADPAIIEQLRSAGATVIVAGRTQDK